MRKSNENPECHARPTVSPPHATAMRRDFTLALFCHAMPRHALPRHATPRRAVPCHSRFWPEQLALVRAVSGLHGPGAAGSDPLCPPLARGAVVGAASYRHPFPKRTRKLLKIRSWVSGQGFFFFNVLCGHELIPRTHCVALLVLGSVVC